MNIIALPFVVLAAAAFGIALIAYQLVRGIVIGRYFRPSVRHCEQPVIYWLLMLGQTAVFIAGASWWIMFAARKMMVP